MNARTRDTGWYKSTRSGTANEGCLEVRITDTTVMIRDSKNTTGPSFSFGLATWDGLLRVTKSGHLDFPGMP